MENTLEIEKVKKGFKKTLVGLIPTEWDYKKLSDISEIIMGQSPDSDSYNDNGNGYFLIQGNADIKEKKSSPRFYTSSPTKFCEINDILLSVRAPVGTVAKSLHKACIGRGICALRPFQNYEEFLHQYLLSFESKWSSLEQGSTFQAINTNDIKTLKIPIPPELERVKIASILSTWDEAISNTKTLIEETKKRNKALAQQLLSGKTRLKGFEGKWEHLKISDFSNDISLKNKEDKDLIVLSCTKHHGLVPSLEYFGRKIYSENLDTYKIVARNCFAYATNHIEEGSIGYQDKYDSALISPMYTVFKTNEIINDEFLYKVLKSHAYIHEYQKRMEGSIDRRGGLRWDGFSKIKVSVPSLEEQKAINDILETANQELKTLEQKLKSLESQKKGLMQKLLTGEIRVKI